MSPLHYGEEMEILVHELEPGYSSLSLYKKEFHTSDKTNPL